MPPDGYPLLDFGGRGPDAACVGDAVGNLLSDGDAATLIKDLTVKGTGQRLQQGTLISPIRLTGDRRSPNANHQNRRPTPTKP